MMKLINHGNWKFPNNIFPMPWRYPKITTNKENNNFIILFSELILINFHKK